MLKKILFLIIGCFCSFFAFAAEFDANMDYSTIEEKNRLEIYDNEKVEVYQREYYTHGKDKGVVEAIYGDAVLFDLYKGDGNETKLSTIAYKMGNNQLGDRLKLGECYYGFMAGVVATSVTTGVLLILGVAFTVFRNGFDFAKYEYCATEELNEYMTSAIVMFSISAVTLVGVIIFSVYLYNSSLYKFNIIQAKSLVNQYNKFLRKKLGVLQDIDVSYSSQKVGLSMRIAL